MHLRKAFDTLDQTISVGAALFRRPSLVRLPVHFCCLSASHLSLSVCRLCVCLSVSHSSLVVVSLHFLSFLFETCCLLSYSLQCPVLIPLFSLVEFYLP